MMRRISQRQARRMMEQMGMKVEPLRDVVQVVIKMHGRELLIDHPEVTVTYIQGQAVYQVVGGKSAEVSEVKPESPSEEDVQLVAQQSNVTPELARRALEETKGDLAQAILLLTQRRSYQ
ncbi:MAG: nascent polypeptide-associated complex protein [Candidatus Bathyarchaeia archaeon]